jgi:hypothetical protein
MSDDDAGLVVAEAELLARLAALELTPEQQRSFWLLVGCRAIRAGRDRRVFDGMVERFDDDQGDGNL